LVLGWSNTGPIETIAFQPASVGVSKDGTAANTLLFMRAWDAIKFSTDFDKYDWTLKVDPDAVLLPDRLRSHLAPYHGKHDQVYVTNCNKYQGPGWPMMFGSVEVFSRGAIQAYFQAEERCKNDLKWKPWGEDYFMNQCLDYLHVNKANDFSLVADGVCKGVKCSDPFAAAFHPFKSTATWLKCWRKATGTEKFFSGEGAAAEAARAQKLKGNLRGMHSADSALANDDDDDDGEIKEVGEVVDKEDGYARENFDTKGREYNPMGESLEENFPQPTEEEIILRKLAN
jgi:hypothetical protein